MEQDELFVKRLSSRSSDTCKKSMHGLIDWWNEEKFNVGLKHAIMDYFNQLKQLVKSEDNTDGSDGTTDNTGSDLQLTKTSV